MNRTLMFLIGCIGVRISIALIAKIINLKYLPYLGTIALIPAFGFLYLYIFNLRKTGVEAGGNIWWSSLRPIHAGMYILFAAYSFRKKRYAWLILLADAILGLSFWVMHRFFNVNFI